MTLGSSVIHEANLLDVLGKLVPIQFLEQTLLRRDKRQKKVLFGNNYFLCTPNTYVVVFEHIKNLGLHLI